MDNFTFDQERLNDPEMKAALDDENVDLIVDEVDVCHDYEDCPNITGKTHNVEMDMHKAISLDKKHRCPNCEKRNEDEERYWMNMY